MAISFNGIYDIRFPHGTSYKEISKRRNYAEAAIQDAYSNVNQDYIPAHFEIINFKDNRNGIDNKGIRVITANDNPFLLAGIFESISPNLTQKYIDRNKEEYVLDVKA